jgi:hypothetical protein
VLLAVGAEAVEDVLQAAGPLDGKVLIDATNEIDAKFGSLAGRVAELATGAKVVKAFNATFAPVFDAAAQLDPPPNLVFCGDDERAKETVLGLISDALERLARTACATRTDWALGIEARSRTLVSEGDAAVRGFRDAIEHLGRTLRRARLRAPALRRVAAPRAAARRRARPAPRCPRPVRVDGHGVVHGSCGPRASRHARDGRQATDRHGAAS